MDLKKVKLRKILYLPAALVAVIVLLVFLICYHPAYFSPVQPVKTAQVSPYLTNTLSPQIYNGAQLQQPFEVTITQEGINDILTQSNWSKTVNGIKFSTPQVFFAPDYIVITDQAICDGADFAITIVGKPFFDENRLLNLRITSVKVGVLTVTSLAKIFAANCYKSAAAEINSVKNDWPEKIASSLLRDKPFDPLFNIDGKKIRLDKITVSDRKLTAYFIPASK